MKWIVILGLFIVNSFSYADEHQLLKCLGEEEKTYHLNKVQNPAYDLGQRLIAEMVQIPQVKLTAKNYSEVCEQKVSSRALKLLEISLKQGRNIFVISENHKMQRMMTEGMIDDYIEITKEIFLNYISQIQTLSPTPNCLKEEIPALDKFFTEIKYLQEDVDIREIFKNREIDIFEKLQDYPKAFKKCQLRMSKKTKSGSTAPPKKS